MVFKTSFKFCIFLINKFLDVEREGVNMLKAGMNANCTCPVHNN